MRPVPTPVRLTWLLVPLAVALAAGGCDTETEGTMPVVQIVGADLRYNEPLSGPTLGVWAETREVGRVPPPPCDSPYADCVSGEVVNEVIPERTRLVADRAVRVGGAAVEPGTDLIPLLDDLAYLRLSVYPFAVAHFPVREIGFATGRTRLTASWETDDGLAFSATAAVRR